MGTISQNDAASKMENKPARGDLWDQPAPSKPAAKSLGSTAGGSLSLIPSQGNGLLAEAVIAAE